MNRESSLRPTSRAVVFRDNKARRIVILVIGIIFLGIGSAVVPHALPSLAIAGRNGPLMILAGVLAITASPWRLVNRKPRLIVDSP